MEKKLTQEEFDNMPAIGPSVNAFLDLLAGIAARMAGQSNEETETDETDKKPDS